MENGANADKLNWKTCARLCRAFFGRQFQWGSNFFAGPVIAAGLNQQGRAESSNKLYCIRVYVMTYIYIIHT